MRYLRLLITAVVGLVFGLFVGLDLVVLGAVALNSVVVTLVAVAGLAVGAALGWRASTRA